MTFVINYFSFSILFLFIVLYFFFIGIFIIYYNRYLYYYYECKKFKVNLNNVLLIILFIIKNFMFYKYIIFIKR